MSADDAKPGKADVEPEESAEAQQQPPGVVCVFMDKETLVNDFRRIADAVNGSNEIKSLKGERSAVCITKVKNGFTRHLFMGDLDAQPFEYSLADWDIATQRYKHMPDVIWRRDPGLVIVLCEDLAMPIAVIRSAFAGTAQELKQEDLKHLDDAVRQDLRFGDVAIYRRDGYSEDDPSGVFDLVFSTRE